MFTSEILEGVRVDVGGRGWTLAVIGQVGTVLDGAEKSRNSCSCFRLEVVVVEVVILGVHDEVLLQVRFQEVECKFPTKSVT